jgi:hypothetical protein
MLHYKMRSLILTSLESSVPILAACCANKPMVAISPSYQKGDEMLSFTHLYVNLSLGPSAIAASSSPIWVELESEGSLVAFSEIGYHHFTSSSGLKMTTPPKRHFNPCKSWPLQKWWKLLVLTLKKWKVHTNTEKAKSKGLGFLSKAKKP